MLAKRIGLRLEGVGDDEVQARRVSLLDSGHMLWAVHWQQQDRSDVSVVSSLSVFDRP